MAELRPYQREGAAFLAARNFALLADEMGLGKTPQAIEACDLVGARKVLVVCPAVARTNWIREFERWSVVPRPAQSVDSAKVRLAPGTQLVVASYEMASSRVMRPKLRAFGPYDVLIVDEAHYCKGYNTDRTKSLFGTAGGKHARTESSLMGVAGRTWLLTGTPAPNHQGETFVYVKSAGLWDYDYWAFMRRFTKGFDGQYGYKVTGPNRSAELKTLVEKFTVRRTKKSVGEQLPPITWVTKTVDPVEPDLSAYVRDVSTLGVDGPRIWKGLAEKELAQLETIRALHGEGSVEEALSASGDSFSRLRRYTGLLKAENTGRLIADMLETDCEKIVVFAHHREVVLFLHEYLRSYGVVGIWGGTKPEKRQLAIDKFQTRKRGVRVFLANIEAAGTAITLTAAHHLVFAELSWVPAQNAQAAMRVHRIGQEMPVTVTTVALPGSVDEIIVNTLRRKSRDLVQLFDK